MIQYQVKEVEVRLYYFLTKDTQKFILRPLKLGWGSKQISLRELKQTIYQIMNPSIIKQICLRYCNLGTEITFLSKNNYPQLKTLDLHNNNLKYQQIEELLEVDCPKLDTLYLSQNPITDKGIIKILGNMSVQIKNLTTWSCGLTDHFLKVIIEYNLESKLHLNICSNKIKSEGIKWLTKLSLMNLQSIYIGQCAVGDEGIKHLTKANWPHIISLSLSNSQQNSNNITINSSQIVCLAHWRNVKDILHYYKDPVFWLHYVLIEAKDFNIYKDFFFGSHNQKMKQQIISVLEGRNGFIQ